jgi:glyoxylase-like metal-dependent hydrolase (beta-lactamase superfamily II)
MTLAFARRMWALDCPTLTVEGHTLMYGLTGMVTIPMPAFLIEHPKGLVLFDTGIAPEAIDDPAAVYGRELADALGMVATPDQRLDRQLAAVGYDVADVTHVICSHMHFDHSGGHHLFPGARFYVGQGELAFAHFPDPIGAFCYIPDQLARLRDFDWREVPGVDVDLFGDGSLVILFMPGHTPGELSLKVRLASRTFILTGDAVHLRAALENEFHFPIDADTKSALRTVRRIKRLRESEEATVWITHDPDDWAELKHAPYCFE